MHMDATKNLFTTPIIAPPTCTNYKYNVLYTSYVIIVLMTASQVREKDQVTHTK